MTAPLRESLAARVFRSSPVRLVLELVVMIVVLGAAAATAGVVVQAAHLPRGAYFAVDCVFSVPAAFGAYVFLVRVLERRKVDELALRPAVRELGAGFAVGAAAFSATIGVIAALGGYTVDGTHGVSALASPLAMGIVSGVTEEILVRGVLFRLLERWLGSAIAIVVSSALFGFAHITNPHATVWSALAIAVEAGTFLAAAYMVTRRLWLPIGVHAAWNFTQGGVFGVAVSGTEVPGLLHGVAHGPAWLSGGDFGAEASVAAMGVCVTLAATLLFLAIRKGHVVPPPWAR
jgi:membrane protease YdiL (CAAX protease family)